MTKGGLKPLRRAVTGHDAHGRSTVIWDGPAPAVHESSLASGRSHIDLWVWNESPVPLAGTTDDSHLAYDFPGPPDGGHFRVVQWTGLAADYDPANDPTIVPPHPIAKHELGRRWDRGGLNSYTGAMHKTESVDYAILLEGEPMLVLDDREVFWAPGDIIIDVAAWHQWSNRNRQGRGVIMAFDMMAARFVDGPAGVAQGSDRILRADPSHRLPPGVRPARRIVIADREAGRSTLISDGPSPDVRVDPARPGFAVQRMWVTDGTPAKIVLETLHLPYTIEPPIKGSVLNVVTIPPDESWKGKVGEPEVRAFFRNMGSPQACTWAPTSPHPYMQRTRSIDFVIVVEGEIVLVLDTQELVLKAGEFVVQRGTNHAWSNRTGKPAVLAIASHDGA